MADHGFKTRLAGGARLLIAAAVGAGAVLGLRQVERVRPVRRILAEAGEAGRRLTGEAGGLMHPIEVSSGGRILVHNTGELIAAAQAARGGEVIALAPGEYSGVTLRNVAPGEAVTITSADPSRPSVIHDVNLNHAANLIFKDLEFSTAGAQITGPGQTPDKRAETTVAYLVAASSHITFDHLNVHGAPDGTLYTDITGFELNRSDHVVVENSEFQHLHNAIGHIEVDYLTVQNNHFHDIWDDGLRGGGSSHVTVQGNRFHTFHMNADDKDHPDCIQFWTSHTTASVTDLVIRDNVFYRDRGHYVQGIFLRDELNNIPYLNVTIDHNLIIGAQYNGIAIDHGSNITITNNVVAPFGDMKSWIAMKNVDHSVSRGNRAGLFIFQNADVAQGDNQTLSPISDGGAALLKRWKVVGALAAPTRFAARDHARG